MATPNVPTVFFSRADGLIHPVSHRNGLTVKRVLEAMRYSENEIAIAAQTLTVNAAEAANGIDTVLAVNDLVSILPAVKGA